MARNLVVMCNMVVKVKEQGLNQKSSSEGSVKSKVFLVKGSERISDIFCGL